MTTGIQSSAAVPGSASDLQAKVQAAKDAMSNTTQQNPAPVPGSPQALANAGILPPSGAGPSAPTPSTNAALDTPQKMPQNPNLSAMEQNQQRMADAKQVSAKVYHSFPGSSYFAPDGTRFEFDHKGELSVENAEVQKQLDAIADKPGSPVYARNPRATPAPGDDLPVKDIQARAAETMAALTAQSRV